MRRKIFIAVDLPGDLKRRLRKKVSEWENLPVIWTREENLHLTLVFLGYVDDEQLPDICQKVKMACSEIPAFDVMFNKIGLGPHPNDAENARMIWLTSEPSEELTSLVNQIEDALGVRRQSARAFNGHVTLGRIKQHKWRQLPITNIDVKMSVSASASEVVILESTEIDGKREYLPLETCELA